MAWYFYAAQLASGALLVNGAPHFVRGLCGERFQSPFASPPGIGESSALVNFIWGFVNLAIGLALLGAFAPRPPDAFAGWIAFGAGALLTGAAMSRHFARVRGNAD
jgi:hypothetical protein